eukprot:CAMPEP_0178956058 /NCGR_PEP_ID=MMETSP0789-20121207/9993_1 /TAXON_ID=3005 /ORGANISM="Rhizosolenia setigera, Strain CCMP 1694" /LENGTH=542 /DNA_ID=CAMNT_0020637845 /DNA_START=103 /DNA_END=1731 /DNA_ORIENTATION=-
MSDDEYSYAYDEDDYVYEEGNEYDEDEEDQMITSDVDEQFPSEINSNGKRPLGSSNLRYDYVNSINAVAAQNVSGNGSSNNNNGIEMKYASELAPLMEKQIKDASDCLDIPKCAAAILLGEHKWDQDLLTDRYFNDMSKVLGKCGVMSRCGGGCNNSTNNGATKNKGGQLVECPICYGEFEADEMFSMPCGHEFCLECWGDYISDKLADGPTCIKATCPQEGCNEIITEEEVTKLQHAQLPKFKEYQLRSFVQVNRKLRWCPGAGCDKIAVSNDVCSMTAGSNAYVATCDKCITSFCMSCGEEPHAPATCAELAKWNEKCRNESETYNWILANTKSCPKCSSRIEKNNGCNHMSCSQCKHEFCWICMQDWKDHGANTGGYYKCNKFDPNNADDDSEQARAKREIDRYLHYYKRYHAHQQAQDFAKNQLQETEAKMEKYQESREDTTWSDVEFLKTAVDQLVECRRVLKYTYAFAFYLVDGKGKKDKFEHHQEMLERFTEDLSELSEKPMQEIDRTDVVNRTRVVKMYIKNILEYVDNGMEEN